MFFQKLIQGQNAEENFRKVAETRGLVWRKSTGDEDRYQHIDCWITGEAEWGIDVKRPSNVPLKGTLWISTHGGSENNLGWIYGGKANYIAFEFPEKFLLVSRSKIQEFLDKNIIGEIVNDKKNALYKLWKPPGGNHTTLALVLVSDMKNLEGTMEWEKPIWMLTLDEEERRICLHRTNSFGKSDWEYYWKFFRGAKTNLRFWLQDSIEIFHNCPFCGTPLKTNNDKIYRKIESFLKRQKSNRYRAEISCLA